jgi:hypothetical protein
MKPLIFAYTIAALTLWTALRAQPVRVSSDFLLGVIPGHDLSLYEVKDMEKMVNVSMTYTAAYGVRADILKYGFVSGGIDLFTWTNSPTSFVPFRADYDLSAGLQWHNYEVGITHRCIHPLIERMTEFPLPMVNYYQDLFYLKVKIGAKQ